MFLWLKAFGVAALLFAVTTVSAVVAPDEQQKLNEISLRGQMIYLFDQAAWHTTDALRAKVPPNRMPTSGGGWVVEPRADGALVVTYFGGAGADARSFFVAAYKDGKVIESRVLSASDAAPLTPAQQAMTLARSAALAAFLATPHGLCAQGSPNTVVLSPMGPGQPMSVYILSPQPRIEAFPLGGHYRFDVDPAGKVVAERRFMNSCMTLDLKTVPKDTRSAIFTVSHLLDNIPTEIHVFTSLASHIGVAVITPDKRFWAITGARIQTIEQASGNAPVPAKP